MGEQFGMKGRRKTKVWEGDVSLPHRGGEGPCQLTPGGGAGEEGFVWIEGDFYTLVNQEII